MERLALLARSQAISRALLRGRGRDVWSSARNRNRQHRKSLNAKTDPCWSGGRSNFLLVKAKCPSMTKRALHLPARSGKPPLALLDAAAKALGQCVRVDAAKGIRDIAVAFSDLRQASQGHPGWLSGRLKCKSELKLVAAICSLDMKAKGRRQKVGDNQRGSKTGLLPPSLDDLGITKMQASRWQKLAIMKLAFPKNWEERLRRMCAMAIAITEGDKAAASLQRGPICMPSKNGPATSTSENWPRKFTRCQRRGLASSLLTRHGNLLSAAKRA